MTVIKVYADLLQKRETGR
ncbi:MAG: hypothetical protein M5U34_11725 [Chloroflexi bacterium]|nr:hypothetical protein [Chloroflexota bacterium]